MAGPFSYVLDVVDPVAALQSGMAFGQDVRAGEQNMMLRADANNRANAAFQQDTMLFDQAQADRAAALEAQRAMQADLVGLSQKISSGSYSANDFAAMTAKYPELTDEMSKMWDGQTAERKAADVANLYKGVTAIKAGRPDLAVQMLEDRAVAAENGGDKMEADIARATAAAIKADPNAGLVSLGLLLQTVDPDAAKAALGEAPEKPAGVVELEWRAKEAGLGPGSPEYKDFIARDGKSAALPGTTTINPDGSIVVTKLTESEGKSTGFMYRMEESDRILQALEDQGTSLWNKGAGALPVLGNYLVSPDAQRFDQAKRDFINAILRRESGAVISPEEFANAEVQYFPQPGDGAEVIAQKARNRRVAIDGVRASAGEGAMTQPSAAGNSGSPGQTGQAFDPAEIDSLMQGP